MAIPESPSNIERSPTDKRGIDGTKVFESADGAPIPTAFVAVAVHVYVLSFVKPLTTIGLPEPDAEPVAPPSDDGHVTS